MFINASAVSRSLHIEFRRNVFKRFKVLKERSAHAVDTGIVNKTFKMAYTFGNMFIAASRAFGRSSTVGTAPEAMEDFQLSSSASANSAEGRQNWNSS